MRDLRLIGVHDNGQHLLFSDADGKRYRVPLDEALRVAARRDRARLGQLQQEASGGLTAREVQGLIRRGLSADEVAERAGWDVEKVHRFDGPVLAEREFMALKAGSCIIDAADDPPTTLAARATERLRERGVDIDEVRWDSRKDEGGPWVVSLEFPYESRTQRATWAYAPRSASVSPLDDAARALTEVEIPGVIPGRHAAPGPIVDAPADTLADLDEPIDLAAMRANARARRRSRPAATAPLDADGDPTRVSSPSTSPDVGGSPWGQPLPEAGSAHDADDPSDREPDRQDLGHHDTGHHDTDQYDTAHHDAARHDTAQHDTERQDVGAEGADADADTAADTATGHSAPSGRRGRRSVPSWDDIVFGTKGPDAAE